MLILLAGSLIIAGCGGSTVVSNEERETGEPADRLGDLVTIPAGSFLMGNSGREGFGGPEELPQHSVYLPAYQIGKHEVTRGEYRRFIEDGGYENPEYWSPEGWKWKESDFVVYAGMHGKSRRVTRPNKETKRTQPEHWEPKQEWVGPGDSDYIGFRVATRKY